MPRTTVPINAMCVTPFDERDQLDETALERIVDFLASAGVGIYLGSFGTGEGHLLRPGEIRRLYEIGVAAAGGRVPVYAAALGFTATDLVIEAALDAVSTGVDAVQIHPPRPGPSAIALRAAELERFYADVTSAVRAPIHLTNQTVMVGYRLPASLVRDVIADAPHVVAVNTTDADFREVARLVDAVAPTPVFVGMLSQLVGGLAAGGAGALCFEADIAPALCVAVCEAFSRGDVDALERSWRSLLQLHDVLMRHGNPRSVKVAMRALGLPAGRVRRPYLDLDAGARQEIEQALHALGLAGA